ncbi:MAG: hypothetical protein H0X64_03470 [Gemmatimonadaceae bacterium]|nr:hypothetical protein [Gemmatimonadaceae bacterium]
MDYTDTPLFKSLNATRDSLESAIRDQVDLVRGPGSADWEARVGAALTLPLTGVSAALVGLAHLALISTDEGAWRRVFREDEPTVSDGPVGEPG